MIAQADLPVSIEGWGASWKGGLRSLLAVISISGWVFCLEQNTLRQPGNRAGGRPGETDCSLEAENHSHTSYMFPLSLPARELSWSKHPPRTCSPPE